MTGWRRWAAAAASMLVGAAGVDPAIQTKTQAFLEREDTVAAIEKALSAQASTIPFACPELTLTPAGLLIDQPPPRFDADGTMVDGRVRLRFSSGGCGSFRLLFNVWVVTAPGQPARALAAYPGTTGAAVDLQQAVTPTATVAAGRVLGGCGSLGVIDTTDLGFDAPGATAWRESWLVGGCGVYAQVPLHFIPDRKGGGTRFEVPPEGVRKVTLR